MGKEAPAEPPEDAAAAAAEPAAAAAAAEAPALAAAAAALPPTAEADAEAPGSQKTYTTCDEILDDTIHSRSCIPHTIMRIKEP